LAQHLRPSFVEIDLSSLLKNYKIFSDSSLGIKFFCPMVKANAYGHGDVQIVQQLEKAGCLRFGVGLVEEGIRLREKAQTRSEVLVFGFSGVESARELLHYNLTPVVSDFSQLENLEKLSSQTVKIHIKLNTGMNRLGFLPQEVPRLVEQLSRSKKISVQGIGTHLMSSEDLAEEQGISRAQLQLFQQLLKSFERFSIPFVHAYNSSGAAKAFELPSYSKEHAYGLRIGFGLYGLLGCDSLLQKKLEPVMRLKSQIVAVQKITKGQAVSYGATWVAPRDTTVGVVPIGYADGVPTQLSNGGQVAVRGKFFPVIGRVCMDYTLIDVTELDQPLQEVVEFFGRTHTANEVARRATTIGYDILTRISERVPRSFINGENK
jgi:alanine racemase